MTGFLDSPKQIETSNFSYQTNFLNISHLNQDDNARPLAQIEVNNNYRFIKGNLVLFGKQPDGDSLGFIANNYLNFNGLYRSYKLDPPNRDGSAKSVQLRLEGIDAPEVHYNKWLQPLATDARDYLLKTPLKFETIKYKEENIPVTVVSSEPETLPVTIATSGMDPNGRPISYVFPDLNEIEDGYTGSLDPEILPRSINYKMLESGWAYLLAYTSMPLGHFTIFKQAANYARVKKLGVWKEDATREFVLTDRGSVEGAQAQLIYPKLFRRCMDFFNTGESDFKAWLSKKELENDMVRITEYTTVNIACLIQEDNGKITFQADTNDIIFVEK